MKRSQYVLDLAAELFVDGFAGGGGTSEGVSMGLNRDADAALNHNWRAVAMHRMNHAQTHHFCEDIRKVHPLTVTKGRPVGGLWLSPDCKHFSKAKGGKPKDKNIRGLAWVAIDWVNVAAPRVLFIENVEEFQQWCPLLADGTPNKWRKGWFFNCFVGALRRRGYVVEWREIRACELGAPTIRKRFYLIARRDGRPIVWPESTHGTGRKPYRVVAECLDFTLPCPSIFLSKQDAWTKYRAKRPLVRSSLARIAKGVDRYVLKSASPFIVNITHTGGERTEPIDEPARTITCANRGEKAVVVPVIAGLGGRAAQSRPRSGNEPMSTLTSKADSCLVAVHLTKFNTGSVGSAADAPAPTVTANSFVKRPGGAAPLGVVAASVVKLRGDNVGHGADEPAHTVSAGGNHLGVVSAFLAQNNTGMVGHDLNKPMSTIVGKGSTQSVVALSMVKYFGTDQDPRLDESCHTVTTKHRFGLVEAALEVPPFAPEHVEGAERVAAFLRDHGVEFEGEYATVGGFVIVDLGMRMLAPRELFRVQGFPDSYVIDRGIHIDERGRRVEIKLTKTQQIQMCGNSVCPPVAAALVRANLPEMVVEEAAA